MRMVGALVAIAAIVVGLPVGGQAMRGQQINVCASDVVSWLDSTLTTPQLRCKEWHDQREVDGKAALDRLSREMLHQAAIAALAEHRKAALDGLTREMLHQAAQ